jgi:hypothetical protein
MMSPGQAMASSSASAVQHHRSTGAPLPHVHLPLQWAICAAVSFSPGAQDDIAFAALTAVLSGYRVALLHHRMQIWQRNNTGALYFVWTGRWGACGRMREASGAMICSRQ